jgi:hypothetical protein
VQLHSMFKAGREARVRGMRILTSAL